MPGFESHVAQQSIINGLSVAVCLIVRALFEVILAVRTVLIWIDVSTFEYLGKFRSGHQSSRARIPGVLKIGVQNLLLHTAKVGSMMVGMASISCSSKKGAFDPFYISSFFSKGIDDGPSHIFYVYF